MISLKLRIHLLIFACYTTNYYFLLKNNRPYWDDWILINSNKKNLFLTSSQAGSVFDFYGYFHSTLVPFGPGVYHILTFILFYLSGLMFKEVLNQRFQNKSIVILSTILYLILPFNYARICMIDAPYSLCNFLFLFAWANMYKFRRTSLMAFFLSFIMNSLLLLYIIPLSEMSKHYKVFKKGSDSARKIVVPLIMPIIFIIFDFFIYRPSGSYSRYNENFGLSEIPSILIKAISGSIFLLNEIKIEILIVVTLLMYTMFKLAGFSQLEWQYLKSNEVLQIKMAIKLILFGAFPYLLLQKIPSFDSWESRHQILLPLGISIMISSFLAKIRSNPLRLSTIILTMGLCTQMNIQYGEYLKQEGLKDLKIIQTIDKYRTEICNIYVVDDRYRNLLAIKRNYRFYEINGMLAKVLGNEDNFGVTPENYSSFQNGGYDNKFITEYLAANFQREKHGTACFIFIEGSYNTNISSVFKKLEY